MHGCGNDFIILDNRSLKFDNSNMGGLAKTLCQKGFGIYADGLVFLDAPDENTDVDYIWSFYNKDGSEGEMCGNAARCAALLAHKLGMAPAEHRFGTACGGIDAAIISTRENNGIVRIQLPSPDNIDLNLEIDVDGKRINVHRVVVGVQHIVFFTSDPGGIDVDEIGRKIRYHKEFEPLGTNVNFVRIEDRRTLSIRTYERGVEGETFACGTGATSAQVAAHLMGYTDRRVIIKTRKNFNLEVLMDEDKVYLQGPAQVTFKGDFFLDP